MYVQNARSKRSRVNGQNAPMCTGHGRFERTHSRVYPSLLVSPSLFSSLLFSSLLFSSLSPLMRHSFSPSLSSRLSLSLVGSLSVLNNKDNDRSSSWLSLYTRPYLALRARVRRPWPAPFVVNRFASSKKLLSKDSCASLVPLGTK